MTPTPEQDAIATAVAAHTPLRVIALAGTVKTSTLALAAQRLSGQRVLYLAYNRSVAADARRRFPAWVEPRTAHSLAFAAVGRVYGPRLANSLFALRPHVPRAATRRITDATGLDPAGAFALVVQTLNRFLHEPDPEPTGRHIPPAAAAAFGDGQADIVQTVTAAARSLWRRLRNPADSVPVTHDVYLKLWQLQRPPLPYDVIFLDEAQDADPVILDIVRHQPAQLVLVGDPYQAIYGWRNARDALAGWRGLTLSLTTSWRFGSPLAAPANQVLERLGEARRLVGGGSGDSSRSQAAIVSRTTIGLIDEALGTLRTGRRVAITGGSEPLAALLDGAYALWRGDRPRHPDLQVFRSWRDLQTAARVPAGAEFRPLVTFVRREADEVPRIARQLRHATVAETQAEVVLTTAHKAKGREWPTVTCLDNFRWPEDPADREEAHLIYVALTRAQHTLHADRLRDLVARAPALDTLTATPASPTPRVSRGPVPSR